VRGGGEGGRVAGGVWGGFFLWGGGWGWGWLFLEAVLLFLQFPLTRWSVGDKGGGGLRVEGGGFGGSFLCRELFALMGRGGGGGIVPLFGFVCAEGGVGGDGGSFLFGGFFFHVG